MTQKPIILWIRRSFRLHDNDLLRIAQSYNRSLIVLYIYDPDQIEKVGSAAKVWLHHSLKKFDESLKIYNQKLLIRQGRAQEVLQDLIEQTHADLVLCDKIYEPNYLNQDERVGQNLNDLGVQLQMVHNNELFEPHKILNGKGEHFKLFSSFWKSCLNQYDYLVVDVLDKPEFLKSWEGFNQLQSLEVDQLDLLPHRPNWAQPIINEWSFGEKAALEKLNDFVEKYIHQYDVNRNRPDLIATSALSPHLYFGEISPRTIWHRVKELQMTDGSKVFLSEVGWREFAHYLLFHNPTLANKEIRSEFANIEWLNNLEHLKLWQKGQTGYPIVDAAMRQLWSIGWMHNRCRMIVASFLIKHLLIDWRYGAAWFMDTLCDADEASNSMNWQWVAGCGVDAAPYFRIFNPILQGEKFDPEGYYVRKWVPELAKMPVQFIHKPWQAPQSTRLYAGVELGKTYPNPIVDHDIARVRALETFKIAIK